MAGSKKDSVLVNSVLSLQEHLSTLERIGAKINAMDMTSDIDVEHVQKLLTRFAEAGQHASSELSAFSAHLQQAQARAETMAEGVSRQAEAFQIRREEQRRHLERFQTLGEKVRQLNARIGELAPPSEQATIEGRTLTQSALQDLDPELNLLIAELEDLQQEAHHCRMKDLEKSAHSLAQTLQAVHARLRNLTIEQ